jgi:hypothetical protein
MRAVLALLFFLSQPFWETKPPEVWTPAEIDLMRRASPWAQMVGPDPEVLMWLATAQPIEEAETEARIRLKRALANADPDYLDFLRENRATHFVLALSYPGIMGIGRGAEEKRMEDETAMVIGSKTYKIAGFFPPTSTDPVLRLVFPRAVNDTDKTVKFRFYLPGLSFPERESQFAVKDLKYHGALSM